MSCITASLSTIDAIPRAAIVPSAARIAPYSSGPAK